MSALPTVKLDYLQGLRGIAILAVVLFHFFPQHFNNGYLGVDVFFILSGYLMTMMLSRKDVFQLCHVFDFWYRRVKRIAPLYYLVIAMILGLLTFAGTQLKTVNVKSATTAALFATNLIRPTGAEGYFEKLGVAVDMFTHTWSLSVEMQFYLIVPFIFLAVQLTEKRLSLTVLYIITFISFAFYYFSDEFTSFNSMYSRIWQFATGMLSYFYINKSFSAGSDNEKEALLGENNNLKPEWDTLNLDKRKLESPDYSIGGVLVLLFFPTQVTADTARVLISLLTMSIFQYGKESSLLKHWFLVFVGEVSYSWYLVHWPIAAYTHLFYPSSVTAQLIGIFVSFFVAGLFHFGFERFYVKWEKPATISVICIFAIAVSGQLFLLKMNQESNDGITDTVSVFKTDSLISIGKYNHLYDYMGDISYGYENKTAEERIRLNDHYEATDTVYSMTGVCNPIKKGSKKREFRCELNKGSNETSPYKLLTIGNSYSSNIMPTIVEECRQFFSHLEIVFTPGCEALVRTDNGRFNCTYDTFFMDAVREVKPNVLFVIAKHMQMTDIKNGTNPFDDDHFKTATDRLAEMQQLVSRRIFILDAFPDVQGANVELSNSHLKKNVTIPDDKVFKIQQKYLIAKVRLQRLVENCPKCRLFDYSSLFFFDGQIKTYDPKYFISFFSSSRHLTPPGVERVRPLIRHLCNNF